MPKKEEDDLELEGHESEFDDPIDDDEEDSGGEDLGDEKSSDDPETSDEDERVVVEGEKSEEEERQEKIREARRAQRKHRKEVQRAREMNYRAEISARDQMLEQLQQRLAAVEQRGQGNVIASIDNEINQLAEQYVVARDAVAKGTDEQNGQLVAQATERMQQIRLRAEQLAARKEALARQEQQRRVNPPVKEPDPRLQLYANRWMQQNSWFNPNEQNRDTMTVRTIDEQLAREGWNPNAPDYWEELSERVKKALPNRYQKEYTQAERSTKSIVNGSSRAASSANSQPYRLSPERVAAMKELGIWEDPKKRAAMIAEYKRYDKEHKVA